MGRAGRLHRLAAGNPADPFTLVATRWASGAGKGLNVGGPTADRRRGDLNRNIKGLHPRFRRQIWVCTCKLSQDVAYVPGGYSMLARDDACTAVV